MDQYLYLLILALVILFWHSNVRIRERASQKARSLCAKEEVQFLDGTVTLERMSLYHRTGQIGLRRQYVFDYSVTGSERCQGFVVMMRHQVVDFGMVRRANDLPY